MTAKYLGVLNGTALAPSGIHDREAVLTFDTLEQAKHVLYMANGGWRTNLARTLDGEQMGDIPGGLGEGARLTLYRAPEPESDDDSAWRTLAASGAPCPDREYVVGPRGGITERAW